MPYYLTMNRINYINTLTMTISNKDKLRKKIFIVISSRYRESSKVMFHIKMLKERSAAYSLIYRNLTTKLSNKKIPFNSPATGTVVSNAFINLPTSLECCQNNIYIGLAGF